METIGLGLWGNAVAGYDSWHGTSAALVVAAWLWLAAEADELEEKRRCLEAVLELDPDYTSALIALAALAYLWVGFGLAGVVVLYGHAAFPLGLVSWIVGSVLVVLRYETMK